MDPLAHANWTDLPLKARVTLLAALLEARATTEDDDVCLAVRALAEEVPRGEGGSSADGVAALNPSADQLRLRVLGTATVHRGGQKYYTFPEVSGTDVGLVAPPDFYV